MNQEIAEIKTDRVNPIKITDEKTGQVYELDFSRESVRFAEARGFKADEIAVFPVTRIPELFYYAFRKNHKNVARSQTNALLDKMGGLSASVLERLSQLYSQAALTNVIAADEDVAKNAEVTVEL